MRRSLPALAAAAAIGLLIWAFMPRLVPVETAEIQRGDLSVQLEAEGEARIREVVVVSAPISGLLQRIELHAGDTVTKGQGVARIGPVAPALLDARSRAVAEAGLAAAEAGVELAQSQLAQAEAALDFATAEAQRARTLFSRAAISQRLLDDAVLAERTAQAAVASGRATLTVRRKEADSARAVLDGGSGGTAAACCVEVTVPVAGRILRVVSEDEKVVAAGTPILEIGNTTDIEIVADVLSRDAVGITEGARATVTGWGGEALAARVERVEPSATTRISALGIEEQRVDVLLSLDGAAPAGLGHGFRVTAGITIWDGTDVLVVPIAALFRDGPDWAVYRVESGRAALRRIRLGQRSDDLAEVTDGLAEGDRVILYPGDRVEDGIRVVD